ncbi:MAG: SEFIR domain-containing protein [bacterium]
MSDLPKVFISYSWTSPTHQDRIRSYAERLRNEGVDVVLDLWDLQAGQDKLVFMEKMVNDPSITHVLIFSDKRYADKANDRKAGVGTESQIISQELYSKVDQIKFVPIFCEKNAEGEPILPTYLKSRIGFDFCTLIDEAQNWEPLKRFLFGKPLYEKPALGKPPAFVTDSQTRKSLPTIGHFNLLQDALLNGKPSSPVLRNSFLDAAFSYADGYRMRSVPAEDQPVDERIVAEIQILQPLRDQFIDWLNTEIQIQPDESLESIISGFLERVLSLKGRPPELKSWSTNAGWFDTFEIFGYEICLYLLALLINTKRDKIVHSIFNSYYFVTNDAETYDRGLRSFDAFYGHAQSLHDRNRRLNLNRVSLLADIIKERVTCTNISFTDIMQAEAITLLWLLTSGKTDWFWNPNTLNYSAYGNNRFPFFARAADSKQFKRIALITGITTADELRTRFASGLANLQHSRNNPFYYRGWSNLTNIYALETWDTLK